MPQNVLERSHPSVPILPSSLANELSLERQSVQLRAGRAT
jgi:hypothetical protein